MFNHYNYKKNKQNSLLALKLLLKKKKLSKLFSKKKTSQYKLIFFYKQKLFDIHPSLIKKKKRKIYSFSDQFLLSNLKNYINKNFGSFNNLKLKKLIVKGKKNIIKEHNIDISKDKENDDYRNLNKKMNELFYSSFFKIQREIPKYLFLK